MRAVAAQLPTVTSLAERGCSQNIDTSLRHAAARLELDEFECVQLQTHHQRERADTNGPDEPRDPLSELETPRRHGGDCCGHAVEFNGAEAELLWLLRGERRPSSRRIEQASESEA